MKMGSFKIVVKKWQFVIGVGLCGFGIVLMSIRSFREPGALIPTKVSFRNLSPSANTPSDHAWPALRAFKKMQDSLENDSFGRVVYDSLLHIRPGLADSIKEIEDFYSLEKDLKK